MKGLLVGYGSIGRRHLTNLHSLGVRDWAVVHTGQGTVPFEPPCEVRAYATLDEALGSETPAFAVIANPTALHAATAIACAQHRCDLLLEKPVSHEAAVLGALADAVAQAGVEVLVGFQFRFDDGLAILRDLLANEVVGPPLRARATWGEFLPDWHPWEDWRQGYASRAELGGGVHHTVCHPFDYLRLLFGDVSAVRARFTAPGPLGLGVPEGVDAELDFAGGPTAHVHLDYWTRPPVHTVEVICRTGVVTWNYMTGAVDVWPRDGRDPVTHASDGIRGRDGVFVREARHFLDVVARAAPPACTLADGIAVARLCDAVGRAAAAGRAVSV